MGGVLRVAGLVWAETVMEGIFFIMQTYFTSVWKLSFVNAATILNIWGGLYRILPFFFLFLAETLLGNFATLALSSLASTAGLVLITVATTPVFGQTVSGGKCPDNGCVGHTEKLLFITGMVLIGLGRAARFATAEPFLSDQTQMTDRKRLNGCLTILILIFFGTPIAVIFAFPYIKKWYVLFGLSASCTILATLFFLIGASTYKKPKLQAERSPVTDFARVFIAAAFKITQPFPKDDDAKLHRVDGDEFQSLSHTRILGFLHKAAIVTPGDRNGSWKLCSVSEVESAKALIRLLPILSCFLMCGIVASTANTYFLEQASHMNFNIGKWKPPFQLLLVYIALGKYSVTRALAIVKVCLGKYGAIPSGYFGALFSVLCCAVAAAVERRRVHVLRRNDLLDLPDDGKVPMSALWLIFQIGFAGAVETLTEYGISAFFKSGAPKSMRRYQDCVVDGVTGLGFLCTALSVYVVGEVSEAGSGKSWFQFTLNRSRLDRYYWVLTTLCSLNLIAYIFVVCNNLCRDRRLVEEEDGYFSDGGFDNLWEESGKEIFCIEKGSALELVLRHYK